MKKKIIIVLSFLILALLAGGFWVAGNEKNNEGVVAIQEKQEVSGGEIDTRNWKTYRNEEYGFEVKYPEDWEVKNFKSACVGLTDCAIDCNKTAEECDVTGFSFYNKDKKHLESISVAIIPDRLNDINFDLKTNWMDTMFSGCYVSVTRNNDFKRFYIGSFRPAIDLNNNEITEKESSLCEKNMLNPVFNEMMKTFIPVN